MTNQGARVYSPEVIKAVKGQLLKYEETCRQSVAGIQSDCHRVIQWLRYDQLLFWKNELRKREDELLHAKHDYLEARFATPSLRKSSYVDELKALRRAEQRKEEARAKIAAVKKWASALEAQTEKLMGPVKNLSNAMDTEIPKARAKLEKMIASLGGYLDSNPGEG